MKMRKWIVLIILAVLMGGFFSSSQNAQADLSPAFPGPWPEYIP